MTESHHPPTRGIDGSSTGEPVSTLRALVTAVEHLTSAVAHRHGLSQSESIALRELEVSGSLTPGDIAARTGLTSSSVTNLIDRLERTGHAGRRAHPADRRSVLVDLTDNGREALAWSRALLVHGFDDIPTDRLDEAMQSVRAIAAALERQARKAASSAL